MWWWYLVYTLEGSRLQRIGQRLHQKTAYKESWACWTLNFLILWIRLGRSAICLSVCSSLPGCTACCLASNGGAFLPKGDHHPSGKVSSWKPWKLMETMICRRWCVAVTCKCEIEHMVSHHREVKCIERKECPCCTIPLCHVVQECASCGYIEQPDKNWEGVGWRSGTYAMPRAMGDVKKIML